MEPHLAVVNNKKIGQIATIFSAFLLTISKCLSEVIAKTPIKSLNVIKLHITQHSSLLECCTFEFISEAGA